MNIYVPTYSVGKHFPYCPIPNLRTRVPWLARIWLLVPPRLRALAYDILRQRLPTITGYQTSPIWKLWPGIMLKASLGIPVFDAHALLLVREHTRIPSPTLYDVVLRPGKAEEWGDMVYILMSEIPGRPLVELLEQDVLSETEQVQIGLDIRQYLDSVRRIPNPYPTPICSVGGNEVWSYYLQDIQEAWGKGLPAMDGVAAFHAYEKKRLGPTGWEELKPRLEPILEKQYRITFTHGDLNPGNIMIQNKRVSGLIDWEFAGWMPEYWEFVAAVSSARYWNKPFRRIMDAAGMDKYRLEVHGQLAFFCWFRMGAPPTFDE